MGARRPTSRKPNSAGSRPATAAQPPAADDTISRREWIIAAAASLALTYVFWGPLWQGGGLVGGDLYSYYFPQKVFLADSLQRGELPLWNPLVGFGYPTLGESQTAVLYPPNLLLYRLFSVNTAYNVSQLAHYFGTFLAFFAFARRLHLKLAGGLLAATVFTYGWFPPRICWEWAIIGGLYFALILLSLVSYLQTGNRKWLTALAVFLGLDLLAGHYNLAFLSLLMIPPVGWMVYRDAPEQKAESLSRCATFVLLAVSAGFLLGCVQLLPSWELKIQSARAGEGGAAFSPTSGHLPPSAISQLWIPWKWYAGEESMDALLSQAGWLRVPDVTNQVEAQLYAGLLPLMLAIAGILIPVWRRNLKLPRPIGWMILACAGLFIATGWPVHGCPWLPGLGFFRGPGRYGLIAVCSIALLSGAALDAWMRQRSLRFLVAVVLVMTAADLWGASRQYQWGSSGFFGRGVFYATMIDDPPLNHLSESPLRDYFRKAGGNARLFAPGANMPTLLGVSALPVYLGLGPRLYDDPKWNPDLTTTDPSAVGDFVAHLREAGVTHLLLQHPLEETLWPVENLGPVIDPVLNRCYARQEPFYFYLLKGSPGRVSATSASGNVPVEQVEIGANRVRISLNAPSTSEVVLRDLNDFGWKLMADAGVTQIPDLLFRRARVEGGERTVEWVYRPYSVLMGAMLSLTGLSVALSLGIRKKPTSG